MPQEQFQRVKQNQNPSPESSEDTLHQAARAWNNECLRYEIREIISPASIKQAMEMQAEAEHRKRAWSLQSEGDQQSEINLAPGLQPDCDSVE